MRFSGEGDTIARGPEGGAAEKPMPPCLCQLEVR